MRITYDPNADALYILLRDAEPKDSADMEDGVTADLDEGGHVIGIEILDARERLGEESLASVCLDRLPLSGAPA